jgi:hypothetical protein
MALAGLLVAQHPAAAQSCTIPTLNDNVCANAGGSIDDYISCYRALYDQNVIPAFKAIATCSHAKASNGIRLGLESVATLVTDRIKHALAAIDAALNDPSGPTNTCIGDLDTIAATLQPYLDGERNAPDLDAYRRARYTPEDLTFIEGVLLTARQARAACDGPLQTIRSSLNLLSSLKASQPDYCEIMRQSASYESVSHIDALAQWTAIDPNIHFDQFFNIFISLNPQCGYYDFSGSGQATVRPSSCPTATLQYSQTLTGMDGALGWLVKNRNAIVAVSTAAATTIFSMAGYGSSAGPYGALVGLGVGLVIAGFEYISLQQSIDELNDLIASKERELEDVVAANLITEDQFADLITQLCTPWAPVVEQRVQDILAQFDVQSHLRKIDGYYTLSDQLNDWYNGLFLWAITPGQDGTSFLDVLAQEDLLAQKNQFDQRIFAARATEEVAAQKTELTNIKGTATLLVCSNLSASQKRAVRSQLNTGINGFNGKCRDTMNAVAVQPDQPVAFADTTNNSSVVCSYNGFRSDVASLEIHNGDGFASNMTLKDPAGTVLAQLVNVTSDTNFAQAGFPGFGCASPVLQAFGTSAGTRLAEGVYPLHIQDNLSGFRDSDASTLRTDVQTLDSQLRFKAIVCARQLGFPFTAARTGDACGIPTI